MIKATFFGKRDLPTGFEITGHSAANARDTQGRLVCAAVSSAAIMTANAITDVVCDNAAVRVNDGFLSVSVKNADKCKCLLCGLLLHLEQLQNEYPKNIKVITEVEP